MSFIKNSEDLQKRLQGSRWLVLDLIGGATPGDVVRIDDKTSCRWSGSKIIVENILVERRNTRENYQLNHQFLPIFDTEPTIQETSINRIIPNNKFDKYKGKLVIEIKNDRIYISNNVFNLVGGNEVVFSTSTDGKLFICKALEQQGVKPYRNRIAGNEAKNLIEIIKSTYGDKDMFSVKTTITKDLDNPDYCFYEVYPKIDKVKPTKKLKEEVESLLDF